MSVCPHAGPVLVRAEPDRDVQHMVGPTQDALALLRLRGRPVQMIGRDTDRPGLGPNLPVDCLWVCYRPNVILLHNSGMAMHSDQYSRIFLLSHMRAFTSLLGHILGSHPAINGYFEMHISYEDASALDKQLGELRKHEGLKEDSRYLFDKLLHNDYRLLPERLGLDEIKILIVLREPGQTIGSIVDLFARKGTDDLYSSPREATRYYAERLLQLADFCASAAGGYYYFDAECVRRKPEKLLASLGRWLDLDVPLSERYQTFSQTGKSRKGDSSKRIRSGGIDRSAVDYSHVQISPTDLERAVSTYRECRWRMIDGAADYITN